MLSDKKQEYHTLYELTQNAPLYSAPWWLDATCGKDGWRVLSDPASTTMLPVWSTKIKGMQALINPPFTQWLPFLFLKYDQAVALNDMFLHEASYSILDISFLPDERIQPIQPTVDARMKYSYQIPYTEDLASVRKQYNEGLRRNLKEAQTLFTIDTSGDIEKIVSLTVQSYLLKGNKAPWWIESITPKVIDALQINQCGYILEAKKDSTVVASILIGWDQSTVYYLAGGRSTSELAASAHALLLDHAIGIAHQHQKTFDFEGSMHPGIANFFQSFGARPKSFWQVRHFRGAGKIWSLFHR